MCPTGELYVSDRQGSDDTGDSTKEKPLWTILQVTYITLISLMDKRILLTDNDYQWFNVAGKYNMIECQSDIFFKYILFISI